MNQRSWDARYRNSSRLFSGLPNATLVAETADLPLGRALDIGCGEGADAIWLADRGWRVTAIDVAPTALHRAAQTEPDESQPITWVQCDITHDPPPDGPFGLVTMHYIPLLNEAADRVLPRLLKTVGPGGTLLFVTHDISDLVASGDVDPYRYCKPDDVAQQLGPDWRIIVKEERPRRGTAQRGTRHTHDAILRAQRGN